MSKYNQGFSTIEFFVVIIIIALLTGLIMVFMMATIKEANDAQRKADIAQLMRVLLVMRVREGIFPLEFTECDLGRNCFVLDKTLESQSVDIPRDPRGGENYYRYQSDGDSFSLKAIMGNNLEYVYDSGR